MGLVEKKRIEDVDPAKLTEPVLTQIEESIVQRGADLFNQGRYWEAHEVWEGVWKGRTEESRIFFQGIIQAAAGYHLIAEKPRYAGAKRNLEKAFEKLRMFPARFLKFDVRSLIDSIVETQEHLATLGPPGLADFPRKKLPTLTRS